jgi:hypothetical protein
MSGKQRIWATTLIDNLFKTKKESIHLSNLGYLRSNIIFCIMTCENLKELLTYI